MDIPLSTFRKWKREWEWMYKDNFTGMQWQEYREYKMLLIETEYLRNRRFEYAIDFFNNLDEGERLLIFHLAAQAARDEIEGDTWTVDDTINIPQLIRVHDKLANFLEQTED